jgi:Flp pilus assembly pilin Flp
MPLVRLHLLVTRADGQTMPEYGLILAIVCVVVAAAFGALADQLAVPIERVRGSF